MHMLLHLGHVTCPFESPFESLEVLDMSFWADFFYKSVSKNPSFAFVFPSEC